MPAPTTTPSPSEARGDTIDKILNTLDAAGARKPRRRRTASQIVQEDGPDALSPNFQELRVDQYARLAIAQGMLSFGAAASAIFNQEPDTPGFKNALVAFDAKVRAIADALLED